jgi:hypothetical protein
MATDGVVEMDAGALVPPVDRSTIGAGVVADEHPPSEMTELTEIAETTHAPVETSAPSTLTGPLAANLELPERITAMLTVSLTSCCRYFRAVLERLEPHSGAASAKSPAIRCTAAAAKNPAAREQRRNTQHHHRQLKTAPTIIARRSVCLCTTRSFQHLQPASPTFASIKHLTFIYETPDLFISIIEPSIRQFGILTFYVFAATERTTGGGKA